MFFPGCSAKPIKSGAIDISLCKLERGCSVVLDSSVFAGADVKRRENRPKRMAAA
jgi:hypothetical protein